MQQSYDITYGDTRQYMKIVDSRTSLSSESIFFFFFDEEIVVTRWRITPKNLLYIT